MSRTGTPTPYAYLAIKAGGGRKFGMRQAANLPALNESLRGENQILLRSWQLPGWMAREDELKLKDQAALNDQLHQLLSRGVSLVETLEVAASTVRPGVGARITRMQELVSGGTSFADACERVGGFDAVTISVYRGAERTGDLAGATGQLASTARRQLAISGKAVTLLIYPAIVLSISVLVSTGMLIGVIPTIGTQLKQLGGGDMPLVSELVFSLGDWMQGHVMYLVLGAGALAVLAILARGALIRGTKVMMRKLPLMRELVIAQESARFFSVMAAMTRSGVPIADALGVAKGAITHPAMRQQLERMRERLIAGGLLRTLIEEVESLPLATRRLLIASERSGDMEHAFSTLAEDMTTEVENRSERLLAAMEPVLTVLMFLIIGSFLSAVLLPILTMSSRIQG